MIHYIILNLFYFMIIQGLKQFGYLMLYLSYNTAQNILLVVLVCALRFIYINDHKETTNKYLVSSS